MNASAAGAQPNLPGIASASVSNGSLSVFATILGVNQTNLSIHASAGFGDLLTITSASFTQGTPLFFSPIVTVTGSMSCDIAVCPSGLGFGYNGGTLGITTTFIHTIGGENAPSFSNFSTTQALAPLPFLAGQAFDVALRLDIAVRLTTLGETFNTSDFSHTLRVTGIAITDGSGNPVTDANISAASGLLYSANGIAAPVPEPNFLALLGVSLASLLAFRRRKA